MEAMEYLILLNQMNIKELSVELRERFYRVKRGLLYNFCKIKGYYKQYIKRYGIYCVDLSSFEVFRRDSVESEGEAIFKVQSFLTNASKTIRGNRYDYFYKMYLRAVYYLLEFEYEFDNKFAYFHYPIYSVANTYYFNEGYRVRGYYYGNRNMTKELTKRIPYLGLYQKKSSGLLPLDHKIFWEFIEKYG